VSFAYAIVADVRSRGVWLYWEDPRGTNKVRSPFINACIDTTHRNPGEADVVVLDPDMAVTYVPNINPPWSKIPCVAHRADYLRSRLLAERGGLWLDVDAEAIRPPLDVISEFLGSRDLVGWLYPQGLVGLNFLAARSRAAALIRWVKAQDQYLESFNFHLKGWSDIGSRMLTQVVRPWRYVPARPPRRCAARLELRSSPVLENAVVELLAVAGDPHGSAFQRTVRPTTVSDLGEDQLESSMHISRPLRVSSGISRGTGQWRIGDVVGPSLGWRLAVGM
jgi:Capsular polysaccharide synthesis protein